MVLINQTRKVSDLWCGEKIIIKAIMKVNIAMQCGPVVQITINSAKGNKSTNIYFVKLYYRVFLLRKCHPGVVFFDKLENIHYHQFSTEETKKMKI